MITLNLLPDIKKEYLRAKKIKGLFITGAFFVSVISIAIVALVAIYVQGYQRSQINSSQTSINTSINTLNATEDLDKIVTLQKQLLALPALNDDTTAVNRLFNFLSILTPNDVSITSLDINFTDGKIEVRGNGIDPKAVNTFIDTLKNASFIYTENPEPQVAFSSVVLSAINTDGGSIYETRFNFDVRIFDPTIEGLKLSVPNITSTRSYTEKPKSLFEQKEEEL